MEEESNQMIQRTKWTTQPKTMESNDPKNQMDNTTNQDITIKEK
jgi:hypothetical protein